MQQLAESTPCDLIQFSNISDWMALSDLHAMLASAVNSLKPGGALIGRRLNGDHHLASVMADHLQVDESLSRQLLADDRSFFYREVVVGFR
jgi:S-adenosylmethionine-diacylglycerol 3-amino-3-carboxypropyl transferase